MADIVISVAIADVFKEVARRSSVTTETDSYYGDKATERKQYSQLHGEGDRITLDFVKEAAKEVLKSYISRQGDAIGFGFEFDSSNNPGQIIYRFSESTDPLPQNQTVAITSRLIDNTKDAIIYYVLVSLYRTDGNQAKEGALTQKALELIDILSGDLHRLHD